MSKLEKAKQRLKSKPMDYSYNEAQQLLQQLGFAFFNSSVSRNPTKEKPPDHE